MSYNFCILQFPLHCNLSSYSLLGAVPGTSRMRPTPTPPPTSSPGKTSLIKIMTSHSTTSTNPAQSRAAHLLPSTMDPTRHCMCLYSHQSSILYARHCINIAYMRCPFYTCKHTMAIVSLKYVNSNFLFLNPTVYTTKCNPHIT